MSFAQQAIGCARKAIENRLNGVKNDNFVISDPLFNEKRGVFVTLKKSGQLRGCIGLVMPIYKLSSAIPKMAIEAAFNDTRFHPVSNSEMEDIKIEISVMSEPEKVSDINEIQLGKHGLILSYQGATGLLLPQVPTEQGWNLVEFLEFLSLKAGCHKDAYKAGVIEKFSADIYSES